MGVFVCFFKSVLAFGWIFPLIRGSHQSWFLSFVEKSRKCVVCGGGGTEQKKRKTTRRWLPLQKHQPETSRKVRFLVFAKEFVRFGFVAERALQTRSRRYTDAFFLISRSRACRREDFQDEVRAVPRRGEGWRTQAGASPPSRLSTLERREGGVKTRDVRE